ncbi:hypothetical protein V3C99_015404, partial [Haemonchus contortus]
MFAKAVIELRNKNRFFPGVVPPRAKPARPRTPQRRTVSQVSRQESSRIRSPFQGLIGRQGHTRLCQDTNTCSNVFCM